MQALNFGGRFDQLSLWIFSAVFTQDSALPFLYHDAKKSKMAKKSNQGGYCLKEQHCAYLKSTQRINKLQKDLFIILYLITQQINHLLERKKRILFWCLQTCTTRNIPSNTHRVYMSLSMCVTSPPPILHFKVNTEKTRRRKSPPMSSQHSILEQRSQVQTDTTKRKYSPFNLSRAGRKFQRLKKKKTKTRRRKSPPISFQHTISLRRNRALTEPQKGNTRLSTVLGHFTGGNSTFLRKTKIHASETTDIAHWP